MSLLTEQEIIQLAEQLYIRAEDVEVVQEAVIAKIKAQGPAMWYYRHFDGNINEWGGHGNALNLETHSLTRLLIGWKSCRNTFEMVTSTNFCHSTDFLKEIEK